MWAFYKRFEQEFSEAFSPLIVNLPGGVYIETFILKAIVPSHKVELVAQQLHGPRPEVARKGSRPAYWPEQKAWVETPVYDQNRLLPGNEVIGPAILESEYTTVVIPPQMKYRVDAYGLGIMSEVGEPARQALGAAVSTTAPAAGAE